MTNALKYGFPDGRPGGVWIELRENDEGWIVMGVRDDGLGLPPQFEVSRSKSLGLLLVSDLARQLHGRLETVKGQGEGPGAGFEVTFKVPSSATAGNGL